MRICNCTNHKMSANQISAGCIDPEDKDLISRLIEFNTQEDLKDMEQRAEILALYVKENGYDAALIGGAPYFQAYLEDALFNQDLKAVYAFSQRISSEKELGNGIVEKRSIFVSNCMIVKQKNEALEFINY